MGLSATQMMTVAVMVQQFTESSEALKTAAAEAAIAAWTAFDDWYDMSAVAALATELSKLSLHNQQTTAGLSTGYVGMVSAVAGAKPSSLPRHPHTPVRFGADMKTVHTRPAQVYLRAVALGASHREALNRAGRRAADTMISDITLEDRQAQQRMLDQLGIVTFRRIIRPELSVSGTCGLCIAAADRVYKTGDLMPLHPPTCKCIVMPVIGDDDPGFEMNTVDVEQLYEDAGSNKAADLKRTRYQVEQHGELGPVLTKVGDEFRDANKAKLENDPARAQRMLDAALLTLSQFEVHTESGVPHAAERLEYQHKLVARLQGIVGQSAA